MKKCLLLASGIFITLFSEGLLAYDQVSDFPSVKAAQKNYDLALEAFDQASKKLNDAQSNARTFAILRSEKELQLLKIKEQDEAPRSILNKIIADAFATPGVTWGNMMEKRPDSWKAINEMNKKFEEIKKLVLACENELDKIVENLIGARKLSISLADPLAQSQVALENARQVLAAEIKVAQAELDSKKEKICSTCLPKEVGDIFHRASGISTLYVGHAGILIEKESMKIAQVIGDANAPGTALKMVNFRGGADSFMEDHPMSEFWGAKRYVGGGPLTKEQQEELAFVIAEYKDAGVRYDYFHVNQKGAKKLENGHYQFDCVGFTEHLWERVTKLQRDPTPAEKPILTVWAQRDSVNGESVK